VKRTVAIVAGVVTLGLALYAGSRLTAQQGTPAAADPPPTMKMRFVNLQHVLKNYKRMETLRQETAELFKQYDAQIKQLQDLIDARTKQLQDPTLADKRDALEKEVRRLTREKQDKTEEAKVALDKKQGELIVLVYKEVDDAVRTYCRQSNIELVLHYNDAVTESDRNNPQNIARKMTQGACMPLYMTSSLDISQEIVGVLNAKYPVTTSTPAGGAGHN
jgi:Skp family chaperone for outer membrane proteins